MQAILLDLQEQQLRDGLKMLNKDSKIFILNNMISNINIHINVIESDTDSWPQEKPSKESVLNEMYNKRAALQAELASVQSS